MAHRWHVSHSNKGEVLHVYNYDAKAVVAEAVELSAFTLCHWSGGRLFGHGLGEWAWRVPVGRPVYDSEDLGERGRPWLVNSLASRLFDAETALCRWSGKYADACKVAEVPISSEQARILSPDLMELFDEDAA